MQPRAGAPPGGKPRLCGAALWSFTDRVAGPEWDAGAFLAQPAAVREYQLAQQLLLALLGVRSPLVTTVPAVGDGRGAGPYPELEWECAAIVDADLAEQAQPLCLLAAARAEVYRLGRELSDGASHGWVNAAFGAALVGACHELGEHVCRAWEKLEAPGSANALGVASAALLPFGPGLAALRDAARAHGGRLGGGEVICFLEKRAFAGCPAAGGLLEEAARPFFADLSEWVNCGHCGDELPIDTSAGEENFWAWRLCVDSLPQMLRQCGESVLRCGKLAALLRRSGTPLPPGREIAYQGCHSAAYNDAVGSAELALNAKALLLLRDAAAMHVSFCHKILLCGHGAWLQDVVDRSIAVPQCGLERNTTDIRWGELQGAAREVLAAELRRLGLDPGLAARLELTAADVTVGVAIRWLGRGREHHLGAPKHVLDGISAICFKLQPEWPMTLVLNWDTTEHQYHCLSRVVAWVKCLRQHLTANCPPRPPSRRPQGGRCRSGYGVPHALRSRMIAFARSLEYYLAVEVIEPRYAELQRRVEGATTLAEVTEAHGSCISSALAAAVLGAFSQLEKVLLSMKLFALLMQQIKERSIDQRTQKVFTVTDADREGQARHSERFAKQFDERLAGFLRELQSKDDSDAARRLLSRIDPNGYYAKRGMYPVQPIAPRSARALRDHLQKRSALQ
eukprot:TRINITY_DN30248_c0_g1_i1.p1 TRINITY_DN30248_c0_g1~~TRINITY_DN30248_c0_g1_i1.p1  ORF type:complete len:681 (+),score=124.60 TRINITY_DN30248_c0_g1_i1:74-2116(+)